MTAGPLAHLNVRFCDITPIVVRGWRRLRSHWVWPGIVWAVRFWIAGFVVLAVAFILAPFSEAASAVFEPGRHAGSGNRVFDGKTSTGAIPAQTVWEPGVVYARPAEVKS